VLPVVEGAQPVLEAPSGRWRGRLLRGHRPGAIQEGGEGGCAEGVVQARGKGGCVEGVVQAPREGGCESPLGRRLCCQPASGSVATGGVRGR
jgi:hypothetical protein